MKSIMLNASFVAMACLVVSGSCLAQTYQQAVDKRFDALDTRALAVTAQGQAEAKRLELLQAISDFEDYVYGDMQIDMELAGYTYQQMITTTQEVANRIDDEVWNHYGFGTDDQENGVDFLAKGDRLLSNEAPGGDFAGGWGYYMALSQWNNAYDRAFSANVRFGTAQDWFGDAESHFASGVTALSDIESDVMSWFN